MKEEKRLKLVRDLNEFIKMYGKEEVVKRLNGFIMTSDPVYLPVENDIRLKMGGINTRELLDLILEEFIGQ